MNLFFLKFKRCPSNAGFSLLGTALLIVAIGLMSSVGIVIYKNYSWNQRYNTTNSNLRVIYEALLKYRYENDRLPCPAALSDPLDSATFGKEQAGCGGTVAVPGHRGNGTVRYGAVPIRTLNLPDGLMIDGWEHRYVYAVTEFYTDADSETDIHTDEGAIRVIDGNGEDVTIAPGNVVFTVLSPGSDDRGSYSLNGHLLAPCDESSPAGENCDANDSVFLSSIKKQWDTEDESQTYTTTMAYLASSKSYTWTSSNWTECNCETPNANQTRTATCVDELGNQPYPSNSAVNDSFCSASSKPELTKTCVAYCWDAGPWSPCDCSGISTRIAFCRTNIHERVGASFCKAFTKPPETRTCFASGCDDDGDSSDPLIFDLTGQGISTKSVEDGVLFDMENTGKLNQTGWVNQHNGFLIRDKNRNGKVDSQSEMFGTTGKPAFEELKDYDSDEDGDITPEDDDWRKLRIWQDANGNGVTDNGELRTLDYWGIRRIPLAHEDVYISDAGNDVTGKGKFEQYIEGVGTVVRDVWEVFFSIFKDDPAAP